MVRLPRESIRIVRTINTTTSKKIFFLHLLNSRNNQILLKLLTVLNYLYIYLFLFNHEETVFFFKLDFRISVDRESLCKIYKKRGLNIYFK